MSTAWEVVRVRGDGTEGKSHDRRCMGGISRGLGNR